MSEGRGVAFPREALERSIPERFEEMVRRSPDRLAQILSRVITIFRVAIPLGELLQAPTVAAMASHIVQRQAEAAGDVHMARMMEELDELSEEEAQRQLVDEMLSSRDRVADGRRDA